MYEKSMSILKVTKSLQMVTAAMKLKDTCSLEEKLYQPRQHIKKQRHYFANQGLSSQSFGFPSSHVLMWEWTIKKAECWRIDAFELWCWRRLLRVSWTARRSNQSILKEISPEYSLEGLMLKLKLQYFGHLMWRTDSLEKTLMLGKIEGRRRRRWQRMRWLDDITYSMNMSLSKLRSWWWTGKPGMLQSMGSQRVGHDCSEWVTELNWTWLQYNKWINVLSNLLVFIGINLEVFVHQYFYSSGLVFNDQCFSVSFLNSHISSSVFFLQDSYLSCTWDTCANATSFLLDYELLSILP